MSSLNLLNESTFNSLSATEFYVDSIDSNDLSEIQVNADLNLIGSNLKINGIVQYTNSQIDSLVSGKENVLIFSSPLNRSGNTISIQQVDASGNSGYLSSGQYSSILSSLPKAITYYYPL